MLNVHSAQRILNKHGINIQSLFCADESDLVQALPWLRSDRVVWQTLVSAQIPRILSVLCICCFKQAMMWELCSDAFGEGSLYQQYLDSIENELSHELGVGSDEPGTLVIAAQPHEGASEHQLQSTSPSSSTPIASLYRDFMTGSRAAYAHAASFQTVADQRFSTVPSP